MENKNTGTAVPNTEDPASPFKGEQDFSVRAAIQPATFNEDARTVEVSFASEQPYRRSTWMGPIDEILDFARTSVRMERFNSGANVLDNHTAYDTVRNVIGVVVKAWVKDKKGYATIRFARSENAEEVFQLVKDGILRNISVGYRVFAYEKTEKDDGPDVWRAIDWEPMELSFVSVPADHTAQVRQAGGVNIFSPNFEQKVEDPTNPTTPVVEQRGATEASPPATPANPPAPAPVVEQRSTVAQDNPATASAVSAERAQVAAIYRNAEVAGLTREEAQAIVEAGHNLARANEIIMERMAGRVPTATSANPEASIRGGASEVEQRRIGIQAALFLRGNGDVKHLNEAQRVYARNYRSYSLLDIARECMEQAGEKTRDMDKMQLVARAFTQSTSDFPVILEGLLRQTLLAEYMALPDSWSRWCKRGTLSDFRPTKRKRQGGLGNLQEVPEGAEFRNQAIPDAESNSISLGTFGEMINLTRQMIINDDLDAFSNLPRSLARAAARTVEAKAYATLAANPVMNDGYALFSAEHGNLVGSGSGGAITVARIEALALLMANQKDPNNVDFLDLRPDVLLCGIGQRGQARLVNESKYDPDVTSKFQMTNIVAGLFNDVIDTPRISGNTHYIFANPMIEPVMEVAFLDGVSEPYLEMQEGWRVDGVEYKVRLDFGVAAIGWRGAAKNFGS